MALRALRTEPAVGFSDTYVLRLVAEHRRLVHLAAATAGEIEKRERTLHAGLASRNLMSLDLGDVHIRRTRTGVTIG